MSSRRMTARLQAAAHDVLLATDVGLVAASDARVLAGWPDRAGRC
jgi:hypothetical protein